MYLLTVFLKKSQYQPSDVVDFLIWFTGWAYFFLWVVSSYPQMWMNFRLKSVAGLSFNYVTFSTLGFFAYSIYNICMYFIPSFQTAYHLSYPNSTHIPVFSNDVAFSLHALTINVLMCIQCCIYEQGEQSLHLFTKISVIVVLVTGIILAFLSWLCQFSLLHFAYYFSTVKLVITLFKCTPQIYHNHKRKSTEGWSIATINTDMAGGILSLVQMMLSAWREDDWVSLIGNSGKLGLALISIIFDLIFMAQHYCLYNRSDMEECELNSKPVVTYQQEKNNELDV